MAVESVAVQLHQYPDLHKQSPPQHIFGDTGISLTHCLSFQTDTARLTLNVLSDEAVIEGGV